MMRKVSRILALLLSFNLLFQQISFAQLAAELHIADYLSRIDGSLAQERFRPLHLRYFSYDSLNDNFKLLLDKGDLKNLRAKELESSTKTLLNYFLVGVTLPNDAFWVNLRPDSEDRIIDAALAQTDVGKIMLEADLQLKKDTAKFTSPETLEGREYWNKLYKKAEEIYGYENIAIPTLTRPWIVPGEIIVREGNDNAYVYKATLKVMLEQDYLKDSTAYEFNDARSKALNEYSSQLIRELIIPKLTKEVNSSKRYASLKQVYYSLILSRWFKLRFAGKPGTYASLINTKNLTNLTSQNPWSKTEYFKQYQKSFQKGEYNIQEPVYTPTGQTIRSYFSGGIEMGTTAVSPINNRSGIVNPVEPSPERLSKLGVLMIGNPSGMQISAASPIMYIWDTANKEKFTEYFKHIELEGSETAKIAARTGLELLNSPDRDKLRELILVLEQDEDADIAENAKNVNIALSGSFNNQEASELFNYFGKKAYGTKRGPDIAEALAHIGLVIFKYGDMNKQRYFFLDMITDIRQKETSDTAKALSYIGLIVFNNLDSFKVKITPASSPLVSKEEIKIQLNTWTETIRSFHLRLDPDINKSSDSLYLLRNGLLHQSRDIFSQIGDNLHPEIYFRDSTKRVERITRALEALKELKALYGLFASEEAAEAFLRMSFIEIPPNSVLFQSKEGELELTDIKIPIMNKFIETGAFIQHIETVREIRDDISKIESEMSAFLNQLHAEANVVTSLQEYSLQADIERIKNNDLLRKILARTPTNHPFNEFIEEFFEDKNLGLWEQITAISENDTLQLAEKIIFLYFAARKDFEKSTKPFKDLIMIDSVGKTDDFHQIFGVIISWSFLYKKGIWDRVIREAIEEIRENRGMELKVPDFDILKEKASFVLLRAIEIISRSSSSIDKNPGALPLKEVSSPEQQETKLIRELKQDLLDRIDAISDPIFEINEAIEFAEAKTPKELRDFLISLTTKINDLIKQYNVREEEYREDQNVKRRQETRDYIKRLYTELGAMEGILLRLDSELSKTHGSSALQAKETASPTIAPGGIDFRTMPMTIQPMGSFNGLNFKLPQLSKSELEQINTDSEIQQIKNMVQAGIMPSGERIKEIVAACVQKEEINSYADNLLLCVADILKLEEDASESSPELKEALAIVDSQS
jgi:hypothetical protein